MVRSTTSRIFRSSKDICQVRLKTTSGILTLCCRKTLVQEESLNGPSEPGRKVGDLSAREPVFEALKDLFDSQDTMSLPQDAGSPSPGLPPDYSSYYFWTPHCISEFITNSFTIDDPPTLRDNDSSLVQFNGSCSYNSSVSHLPQVQSENSSSRKALPFSPLNLEEDIFEATENIFADPKIIDQSDDDTMMSKYLVENPPQLCPYEILDSNLLVYAPPRFAGDAFLFDSTRPPVQTPLSNRHSEIEKTNSTGHLHSVEENTSSTIHQEGRKRKRLLRKQSLEDGRYMLAVVSSPISAVLSDAETNTEKSDRGNCVDRLRKRHRAFGIQGSELLTLSKLRSSQLMSHSTTDHESTIRKKTCVRRLIDTGDSSESAGENGHRTKRASGNTCQFPLSDDKELKDDPDGGKNRSRRPSTSRTKSSYRRKRSEVRVFGSPKTGKAQTIQQLQLAFASNQDSEQSRAKDSPSKGRRMVENIPKPGRIKKEARRHGRTKRVPLPQLSVAALQTWMNEHMAIPYPSRDEKDELVRQTKLTATQVDNWLANSRQKQRMRSKSEKKQSEISSAEPRINRSRKRSYRLYRQ